MRFLTMSEVLEKVKLSRTTIWRLHQAGEFPKRRKLTSRRAVFIESEIDDWMAARDVIDNGDLTFGRG